MARYIEDKYRDMEQRGEEEEDDGGTVGQQGLNPTPNDPKLWLGECGICGLLEIGYSAGSHSYLGLQETYSGEHFPFPFDVPFK